MFRQLAYASRTRHRLSPAETSELIADCRARNAAFYITGVLLYTGEQFLQLIEGRDAAVGALWRKIVEDDRHTDLAVLLDTHAPARWFDAWRAGYLSERELAPMLERWQAQAPQLPASEVTKLRVLLEETQTF